MTKKSKPRFTSPQRNDVRVKLVQMAKLLAEGYSVRKALKETGVSPTTYAKYKDFIWGLASSFNPNVARISREGDEVKVETLSPDEEVKREAEELKKDFVKQVNKMKQVLDAPPFEAQEQINAFSQIENLAIQLDQALDAISRFEQRLANIAQKVVKHSQGYGSTFISTGSINEPPISPPPDEISSSTVEKEQVLSTTSSGITITPEIKELFVMTEAIDKYKAMLEAMREKLTELAKKLGFEIVPPHKAMPYDDKKKLLEELAKELGYELKPSVLPISEVKKLIKEAREEGRKEVLKTTEEKKIDAIKDVTKEFIKNVFNLIGKLAMGQKVTPREIAEAEEKVGNLLATMQEIVEEGEEEAEASGDEKKEINYPFSDKSTK